MLTRTTKLIGAALAAALMLPAAAQAHPGPRHHQHHADRGHHGSWKRSHHHYRPTCRWVWRHHHRVKVCR